MKMHEGEREGQREGETQSWMPWLCQFPISPSPLLARLYVDEHKDTGVTPMVTIVSAKDTAC
jgi:hypothetical protein